MKKLLAMVLALVMTLSLAVSANAAFEDAKDINATYAEAVDVLAGMKVFQGYDNGKTFKPQGDITRAEVAAIVYRIYTADVKDSYVKNYETYNKFSDMAGAGWAKGYIGYCANAALVKGYPNGTFLPSGKVTGYEVLAMILRAVGYDKNNEFTGADWALHVAQIAEQNKILKNVKGIDLSAPASRELVAELLFQAIQVPTVTYTAAFGYQDVSLTADKKTDKLVKANSSLGYKNFKLVSGNDSDDWGRPVTVWAKDANDNGEYDAKKDTTVYATVVATPDAAFHVATSQCDICDELGEKKEAKVVDTYTNGVLDTKDVTYSATETKKEVGAQGQQLEYYKVDGGYRLVVIDTYLAKVNDVITEKTDSKNHVSRDAYLQLDVYKTAKSNAATTLYVKGNDYAEGDYLLVNVNEKATKSIILTNNKSAEKCTLVEVVAKAESFQGAQTSIWSDTYKHTIDKKDYLDAHQFNLNKASKDGTAKYTWFLDQFGNLIGSVEIDNDNYAVLKSIIWKNGEDDHAEAKIMYMDGTEETVTVDTIDGLKDKAGVSDLRDGEFYGDFSENLNSFTTVQGDTNGDVKFESKEARVSTSGSSNKAYQGMALYLVETNKDGSVNLQGIDKNNKAYVEYSDKATVNASSNVLTYENEQGKTVKYAVSSNTKFIVRELDENDKYTYTQYPLSELPKYKDASAEVYFVVGANQFVSYVYIKNATDAAAMSDYIFVAEANNSSIEYRIDGTKFFIKVFVDGKEEWVQTSESTAATLAKNAGKLFKAVWGDGTPEKGAYGVLQSAQLVNESTDSDVYNGKTKATVDYVTGKYFSDDHTMVSYKGYEAKASALDYSWNLDGATIINAKGEKVDFSDLSKQDGIWVVSEENKYEGKALFVYVGEALSDNVDLTASYKTNAEDAKDTALNFVKNDEGVYVGAATLARGVQNASYKYEAADKNVRINNVALDTAWGWFTANTETTTVINENVKYWTGNFKATVTEAGSVTATIKVMAEDGVTERTYLIDIDAGEALCESTQLVNNGNELGFTYGEFVYTAGNKSLTVNLEGSKDVYPSNLINSLKVVDGAKDCTHATIVAYNSDKLTTATEKALVAGQTDLYIKVTPEKGDAVWYKVIVTAPEAPETPADKYVITFTGERVPTGTTKNVAAGEQFTIELKKSDNTAFVRDADQYAVTATDANGGVWNASVTEKSEDGKTLTVTLTAPQSLASGRAVTVVLSAK